jgi:succinate-semialdehyde dehydrogenase / glutarate-semialdehyde dehydrogenase
VGGMSVYVTTNPSTGETVREFPELADAEVPEVVSRAHAAYAGWRETPATERAAVLTRVAEAYEARKDELATIIATEMGKPLRQGAGEV